MVQVTKCHNDRPNPRIVPYTMEVPKENTLNRQEIVATLIDEHTENLKTLGGTDHILITVDELQEHLHHLTDLQLAEELF